MKPFQHVEMFRPRSSVFNLSEFRVLDADMGILYPVYGRKMVPGDRFKLSHEVIMRMNPSVVPLMHEVNIFLHAFFCPLRCMWPKPVYQEGTPQEPGSWEDFMTGGSTGLLEPEKPKWIPASPAFRTTGSKWDYFGFPVDVDPVGAYPDAWLKRAYNWVWNEYYRDQTYMDPVDLDYEPMLRRCWEKDYFTTALPWQQRGIAPALPITGITNAEFMGEYGSSGSNLNFFGMTSDGNLRSNVTYAGVDSFPQAKMRVTPTIAPEFGFTTDSTFAASQFKAWLNKNRVDLSNASTFDVNDLRLAFQTQKFLERNARSGARYTEFLRAHWGVFPRDDRLQRPEYVGGARMPLVVSEVLQTSSTDSISPQGNLAGHGMALDRGRLGSYFAQEFGVLIVLMSIMPRPVYQQGIDREWLGETRYDELLPEFVNLSEQPVYNAEIYASGTEAHNRGVFGFNPRFDEYRVGRNRVVGLMRSGVQNSLAFWHLGRYFANAPALNAEFLQCDPRKDWLAIPSQPAFICTVGIGNRAVRLLPVVGTPGLIDHH